MSDSKPRLRFAPSPTGHLHVGGARTALFNWLYARRTGGVFVLRIEDTDVDRSSEEMVGAILDGLRWLGLDWDEGPEVGGPYGPYFQSQRLDRYRAIADRLVAAGSAYYCYCTAERLQQAREEAERQGRGWTYDRRCLSLTPEEIAEYEATGAPRAVRFRVPHGQTSFDDLVRGSLTFDHAHIEDFVILRSDGHPTYHLSVVADDIDMRITHVIRGDDHISNTPKQLLLYEQLQAQPPRFAHVPLILGPDKKRLSKRHGATSVGEYRQQGFVPEAMINFLALLGWSPGGETELFTRQELVERFSLEGISGGSAVFNPDKLEWMNTEHIARLDRDDLVGRIRPLLEKAGLWSSELADARRSWFVEAINLVQPRVKRLQDFVAQLRPFLSDTVEYAPAAVEKHLRAERLAEHVGALARAFAGLDRFDAQTSETALRATAEAQGVKAATLIHATRVAVTGQAVSPGLFDVLALLGRERTVTRLLELQRFLRSR
ncbi:MAG TPA: glutamate--tRNA ligase [Vicinamibacterales bacterium]|nr:glutamate--tRNA ligase [Vicinamibacterales bacterium]